MRTYFEPDGIRVHDRTAAGSPTLVSLSVAGLGRGTVLAPVSPGVVRQQADRVEIIRPGLVEWYENSAQGLEQGFALPERLQGEAPLVLALAVADATARLKGQSIELTTVAGRRLRYGKLKTIDASGRVLFSRFAVPSPDRVHLVDNDSGARYPLVIDPLLTAVPDTIIESNALDPGSFDSSTFGGKVSSAGDVNNDGFGDIILGAPGFPVPEPGFSPTNEGAFGIFLGSPAGIVATDFSQAQTLVQGDIGQAQLGLRVSAGDIDNDGFDDVIVGALGFAGSLLREGAAYVFRGGLSGIVASNLTDASVRLQSNQSEAVRRLNRYEPDVAGLGDVNNDGFADMALGLGFFDAGELNEGAVFVYYGGPASTNPNQPPVAVAGADQVVVDTNNTGTARFTVDGSLSSDPDGTIVSYAWREGTTLLGINPVLTTTLPSTGNHKIMLTVTDDGGLTQSDAVNIQIEPAAALPPDSDQDGIPDNEDNCILVPNGPLDPDAGGNSQLDTDGDGYGNICDADLNGDVQVDLSDFSLFRSAFGTANPDADFDGDGQVDISDFSISKASFGGAAGPSCCAL